MKNKNLAKENLLGKIKINKNKIKKMMKEMKKKKEKKLAPLVHRTVGYLRVL